MPPFTLMKWLLMAEVVDLTVLFFQDDEERAPRRPEFEGAMTLHSEQQRINTYVLSELGKLLTARLRPTRARLRGVDMTK